MSLLLTIATGLAETAAGKPKPPSPGETAQATSEGEFATENVFSPARLQLEVMDFSDRYVAAIGQVIDEYVATEVDQAKRVAALTWKTRFGSASMTIAASNDPRQGLLDMATFISVGKWATARYWVPEVFGERAVSLNKVYARMDRDIWEVVAKVLTPPQRRTMHDLIAAWEEGNPKMSEVADVRLRNLDGVNLDEFDPNQTAKGVLASLRKLLSKVDTSLLYGERVMFYMERTPRILEQQTTLTLAQIGEAFPITRLQPDLERLNILVDELPMRLQAGIDQNQALIKELLPEVRSTVESGERLAKSLDTTVRAAQEISRKIDLSVDYSAYLRESTAALDHLDSTIANLNRLLEKDPSTGQSKVGELTQLVDQRANALTDKLFGRALVLLGVFFLGVLLTLVCIKLLFRAKPIAQNNG